MPKVKVITEEMQGKAVNVALWALDMSHGQNNAMRIIQNLGRDFSGTVPSLIAENLLGMREKYRSMNETLDQYRKFLEHAANNYDWNDRELAKWAASLGDEKGARINAGTEGAAEDGGVETENQSPDLQDANS